MKRTRHQVNYPETYKLVFDRLRSELGAAASSRRPIKHLIFLLGIPIAYPVRTGGVQAARARRGWGWERE